MQNSITTQTGDRKKALSLSGPIKLAAPGTRITFFRGVLIAALLAVFLPTAIAFLYYVFLAPSRYVSEGHFVVRRVEQTELFEAGGMTMNLVKSFTGGGVSTSMQDAYIVVDYIRSRSVVKDIGEILNLEAIYSEPNGDVFTRLSSTASFEETWEYWNERVSAYVDINSGIIRLDVQAFTPEDAKLVSEKVIELSEKLVNGLSFRSQQDAIKRAESELKIRWAEYSEAETQISSYRSEANTIDPVETAETLGTVLLKLYKERAAAKSRLNTMNEMLDPDAPTIVLLKNKIKALDGQVEELEGEMAGEENTTALSFKLSEYELLQMDVLFKKNIYELAAKSFEKAHAKAEQKELYLNLIAEPNLPEEETYPQRYFNVFFVFITAAIFWSIGVLMSAAVRDHM